MSRIWRRQTRSRCLNRFVDAAVIVLRSLVAADEHDPVHLVESGPAARAIVIPIAKSWTKRPAYHLAAPGAAITGPASADAGQFDAGGVIDMGHVSVIGAGHSVAAPTTSVSVLELVDLGNAQIAEANRSIA